MLIHHAIIRDRRIECDERAVAKNVGIDKLHASFDAEWDGLTSIEVVFYDGETAVKQLFTQNMTVPWEVNNDKGGIWLTFIGRIGTDATIITEKMRYPLQVSENGRIEGSAGYEPTPSETAQILAEIYQIRASLDNLDSEVTLLGDALSGHAADAVKHITAAERAGWNAKAEVKPYASLTRDARYLYTVTFGELPPYGGAVPVAGACSSYVEDGKLHRNFDWHYDSNAAFRVVTQGFEGIATLDGLTDETLDDALIAQLPYCVVDGVNESGIMVSTHVLYNDWEWHGEGDTPLTLLPFTVLSQVKAMDSMEADLGSVLGDLHAPESFGDYLIQVLATDGETTKVLAPKEGGTYEVLDATDTPKLTNFRWVDSDTVERGDESMQTRPTGVERWNAMPCDLADLRFTEAYEEPTRLSEFIGIDGTDKHSTDEELEAIYERAHDAYQERTRDGSLWQTMHSAVYDRNGLAHLWIQEDWTRDFAAAGVADFDALENRPKYDGAAMTGETNIPQVKTATWDAKQDAISDLAAIRSGAALGATAVQSDDLADVATSGSYNDLSDKPTIPTVPTNVSAFTNDAGYLTEHQSLAAYRTSAAQDAIDSAQDTAIAAKYAKPSGGIPKSDLASAVQTSLGKADSALQEHQSLAAYSTTDQMNAAIAAHHDDTKQDTISDLDSIRSGAAAGATALQSVPSTYRTAAAQDTIDAGKVDKVTGKGLSTNDYTTTEKNKLAGIAAGAEVNVNADWNATSGDAAILNKPSLATVATTGSYNDLADKPQAIFQYDQDGCLCQIIE